MKVVSGADLNIYIDYISKAIINQEKQIVSYISNEGIEDALNVIVSLYENVFGVWTLIEERNLGSLMVDEFGEVDFSYTPAELGWARFKINISADNEGNYGDNENYFGFEVVDNGPDISVDLQAWQLSNVVVNNEVLIPAEISNVGNQDASNIQITFYEVSYDNGEQLTQVGQRTIPGLLVSEQSVLEFPYTPLGSGWITFKIESSLAGDAYSGNDHSYGSLNVLSSLTDVSGLFLFYDSYAINNEINYLDIEIRDNDIIGAKNVLAELYDDDLLVGSFSVPELNASQIIVFEDVGWTPTSLGIHNLTLIVTADDDIDLENNLYSELIDVYDQKNTSFNIRNSSGASLPRYLVVNEDKFWVENSPYDLEIVELPEVDIGIENIYYDETAGKDVFTVFLNSNLDNEMNITSEYYEDVSDGDLSFNVVYANNPDWDYDNLSYYILYYDLEQNLDEVSVYGCSDWNFGGLNCQEEWIKNNETYKYIGEEGIYIVGEFDNRIVSIGLVGIENVPEELPIYVAIDSGSGGGE